MRGIQMGEISKLGWLMGFVETETDPVSETLCFLFVEIRTMDKVQKLNSNECYTPSSEPFGMY
jgi:hypothetical protein